MDRELQFIVVRVPEASNWSPIEFQQSFHVMRLLTIISLPCAFGCSTELESGHMLGEFEAFTEAVENLTLNHVAAVESSASVEAIDILEDEHATNWVFFGGELSAIQDELELCDLADGMQEHMDATQLAVDTMMTEMSAHASAQEANSDLGESIANEAPHSATMMGAVEDCLDAHEAMHDGVTCDADHMGGM